MRIIPSCEKCLYGKQMKIAESLEDPKLREEFLREIRTVLEQRKPEDTAPYVVSIFRKIQEKYLGKNSFPAEIRRQYNELIMEWEQEIEARIEASPDPLEKALRYARIGNYIDFGAMHQVKKEELLAMLEREAEEGGTASESAEAEVYRQFCKDCESGNKFVILCDNCGEIVLDKLFLRQLKKRYPKLEISALVRGEEVLNDATMEDAVQCGLTKEVRVVENGNGVAGTVWELLTPKAQEILREADVVLSKGQGNYESLYGYHKPVYYSFLCKCELFITKFQVPELTGMFVREIR